MKNNLQILLTSLILASVLFTSLASASLYVKPAKLGTWKLELFPFSTATVSDTFQVGNTYDFPIDVRISAIGNFTNVTEFSATQLTLQPDDIETIEYTVQLDQPGTYTGGVVIYVSAVNKSTNIAYQADLVVAVTNSDMTMVYAILGLVAVIAIAVLVKFKKKRKGKR